MCTWIEWAERDPPLGKDVLVYCASEYGECYVIASMSLDEDGEEFWSGNGPNDWWNWGVKYWMLLPPMPEDMEQSDGNPILTLGGECLD